MKIFTIIFMLFCMLKSIFYAKYEFTENENKSGGIFIGFISIFGFFLNSYLILI